MCNKGITQFYLPPTHEPHLPLLPSRKVSSPFGWYSLCLPSKGWPGWVNLGGWLRSKINVRHRELNLDTVTHPSTNRDRRRSASLIETNALSLRRTTITCRPTDSANCSLLIASQPTMVGRECDVFGLSGDPSVSPFSVNRYSALLASLHLPYVVEGNWTKLGSNIHHVSWHS